MANYLNWRIIKAIAELQIITKASYSMLIFIPILAGLWPGVRLYVNNHNDAIIKATEILENHSSHFNNSIDRLTGTDFLGNDVLIKYSKADGIVNEVKETYKSFRSDVDKFSKDFVTRSLTDQTLPWTWAAAFFASLLAIIAQMIYQLRAPKDVQRYTLDEFIKHKTLIHSSHSLNILKKIYDENAENSYLEGDKSRNLDIDIDKLYEEIRSVISELETEEERIKVLEHLKTFELESLLDFITRGVDLKDKREMKKLVSFALTSKSEHFAASEKEKQKKHSIIESGATQQYLSFAKERFIWAIVVAILYLTSIIVIFEIIFVQSISVMESAGWENVLDIFLIK